jgi:hypothetical protein
MKRLLLLVAATIAVATFATAVGSGHAAAPVSPAYTVASFPVEAAFGGTTLTTSLIMQFCLPQPPPTVGACTDGNVPSLVLSPIATSDSILWADTADPDFATITAALTDGSNGWLGWLLQSPPALNRLGQRYTESDFFGNQVGPSRVDLAGYTIDRIGFRVDEVNFDSPGANLNGDGIWTDISLRGALVFEGTIASKQSCMNGGWRSLHDPSGDGFHNQGECIRFAH